MPDREEEERPPTAFQPVFSGMTIVEAAVVDLRQQLDASRVLAAPLPVQPADEQRSLATTRALCTELTQQLVATTASLFACRAVTDAYGASMAHIAELARRLRERNAALLAALT